MAHRPIRVIAVRDGNKRFLRMTFNVWIKSALLAGVAASGLVLPLAMSPAAAQSDQWNALYDRIIRLEAEMHARASTPAQPGDAGQMNNIEAQLRQLSFQIEQMQRRQDDLDRRLAAIEHGTRQQGALAPQSDQQYARQQVIIPEQQSQLTGKQDQTVARQQNQAAVQQPGVDLSQYSNQQFAAQQPAYQYQGSVQQGQGPQALNKFSAEQPAQQQQPSYVFQQGAEYQQQPVFQPNPPQQQGQQASGQLATQQQGSLVPDKVETASLDGNQITGSQLADQTYRSAYQSLLARRFGDAEAGFRTFLAKYPNDALAGEAYYWLGETYFAQRQYKQAAQNFLQGYRNYPSGKKAPDSLLKLGMSLAKLGQKPKACGAYAEVTRKYATAAAVRNQALLEMKRAGC